MKANELFPGALVRVNSDGLCIKKGTIVEVRAVDADDKLIEKGLIGSTHCRPLDDNQFDGGIWCEYLDPIPLTPEILEKNGWKHKYYGIYRQTIGETITIDIFPEGCSVVDSRGSQRYYRLRYHLPALKYVHELQHALRLCGIEKEIEL